MSNFEQIPYEKMLNYNRVLSWVHSLRYRETINVLKKFGKRRIKVLEIGCAHAQLFEVLNKQFDIEYYAIEQDNTFYHEALKRYGDESNFYILNRNAAEQDCYECIPNPDVVICLETLEHVRNGEVERILSAVSASGASLFLCSVPVEVGPAVFCKNLASFFFRYHRHRAYSWRETFWASVYRLDKLPPHEEQHKGFDWRHLLKLIRAKMLTIDVKYLPFQLLTSLFANSIFITAIVPNHKIRDV